MNDQNQNKQKQRPEETPKNSLGGASAASSSSGLKKLFAKRWVSPAIFMAAAAIIVTLMWIYQGSDPAEPTTGPDNTEVTQTEEQPGVVEGEEVVDVGVDMEGMIWPVSNIDALRVEIPFYDTNASATEKEAALVQVGNTFTPHTGIDFVDPNGAAFDVLAVLDGTVTHVIQHPTNGHVIEINHGDGLVSVYQSVSGVAVAQGDEVKQGTIIAKAGRNDVERELGVHLHFETRLNGETVNPNQYITE